MAQLIDDLLAFSRLGRKDMKKIMVPMRSLVSKICHELNEENGNRDIEFSINELTPAMADEFLIQQVWVNIISNAVKYSRLKDKTRIEISSNIKDNEVVYSVKDNGAGFDMQYAHKLFGVFQRLHSGEDFEGTGVGLAIVYRILTKHGGNIWATAQPNRGATFYFSLPLC